MNRAIAAVTRRLMSPFWQPWRSARAIAALPWFAKTLWAYRSAGGEVSWIDIYPNLADRKKPAGVGDCHYMLQDHWAARHVYLSKVDHHVDIGSRVDGFVLNCAVFTKTTFVDIRPLEMPIDGLTCVQGSLQQLPFESQSIASISCLHVVEHIGLGRYGDTIDPNGSKKALAELQRVVAPGGVLYLGVPVGRERVCFNAHRVLDPLAVIAAVPELSLAEFSVITDEGALQANADPGGFRTAEYACGLFCFRRAAPRAALQQG